MCLLYFPFAVQTWRLDMHRTNHSPANLNWAHCHSSHDFSDDENQDRASKCGSKRGSDGSSHCESGHVAMRLPCKNSSATWKNPPNTTWLPPLSRGLLQEKHHKTQHSSTVQYTTAGDMKKCRNNQQSCGDGKQYWFVWKYGTAMCTGSSCFSELDCYLGSNSAIFRHRKNHHSLIASLLLFQVNTHFGRFHPPFPTFGTDIWHDLPCFLVQHTWNIPGIFDFLHIAKEQVSSKFIGLVESILDPMLFIPSWVSTNHIKQCFTYYTIIYYIRKPVQHIGKIW